MISTFSLSSARSQVRRLCYTSTKEQLQEDLPFQSVDEILARRSDGDLFRRLLDKFAVYSGISGVQPKVLVRDENTSWALEDAKPDFGRLSGSDPHRKFSGKPTDIRG